MFLLNICLTRLICPRADIQDDAVLIMWSLNESELLHDEKFKNNFQPLKLTFKNSLIIHKEKTKERNA